MRELKFDRLGVFPYSQEEGTPAAQMDGQLDDEIKQKRADEIMLIQADIAKERAQARVGSVCEALVEYPVEEGVYSARTYAEAPEIDGVLFIKSERELIMGEYVKVRITAVSDYDLIGELL